MNWSGAFLATLGAGMVWVGYKYHSGKAVPLGTATTGLGAAFAF